MAYYSGIFGLRGHQTKCLFDKMEIRKVSRINTHLHLAQTSLLDEIGFFEITELLACFMANGPLAMAHGQWAMKNQYSVRCFLQSILIQFEFTRQSTIIKLF